jgi:hypothetical protein
MGSLQDQSTSPAPALLILQPLGCQSDRAWRGGSRERQLPQLGCPPGMRRLPPTACGGVTAVLWEVRGQGHRLCGVRSDLGLNPQTFSYCAGPCHLSEAQFSHLQRRHALLYCMGFTMEYKKIKVSAYPLGRIPC